MPLNHCMRGKGAHQFIISISDLILQLAQLDLWPGSLQQALQFSSPFIGSCRTRHLTSHWSLQSLQGKKPLQASRLLSMTFEPLHMTGYLQLIHSLANSFRCWWIHSCIILKPLTAGPWNVNAVRERIHHTGSDIHIQIAFQLVTSYSTAKCHTHGIQNTLSTEERTPAGTELLGKKQPFTSLGEIEVADEYKSYVILDWYKQD